jgi:hypothetical protein
MVVAAGWIEGFAKLERAGKPAWANGIEVGAFGECVYRQVCWQALQAMASAAGALQVLAYVYFEDEVPARLLSERAGLSTRNQLAQAIMVEAAAVINTESQAGRSG